MAEHQIPGLAGRKSREIEKTGCLSLSVWHSSDLQIAGWSSPVARQAHNLKVAGSNPAPATNLNPCKSMDCWGFLLVRT